MRRRVLTAMLLAMLLAGVSRADDDTRIAVVVHPSRQTVLSSEILTQIYLRRRRFWDDGAPIVPLNLAAGTPLRRTFSRLVLGQGEDRLAEYWNREYFHGVLPPATLASTRAIVRYVASDPNAIGYVPIDEVDASVRVVLSLP
jgi:ABC-type phosphate transport system substrate-binding protein